jgi:5-methylthioadenosine/S-adenosylhomocysteine deaminase
MLHEFSLSSLTVVTPFEVMSNASVKIIDGRIEAFTRSRTKDYGMRGPLILFPAIINPHDHLFGSYHPKIGNGIYFCWLPWDFDLKSSPVYEERNRNTPFELYQIGAFKNLISGVTTVHDHIPHHVNDPYIDKLPIRIIRDYTLAHEVSVYDLKWGDGIDIEYRKAVERNLPFVTHIEEGFDEESLRGIDILEEYKALGDHTVLVHGIGLSQSDMKKIAKKKAHLVWCPGSNLYMFQRTAKVKEMMELGVNVCIGTDSPATGEPNILDEIRFAKKVYREIYGEELEDRKIVEMITINPAKAFRIQDKLGSIQEGKLADLLLVRGDRKSPYSSLVNARLGDIALVIMEGKPLYGNSEFELLFRDAEVPHTKITVDGTDKLVVGDPAGLMENVRKNVGFHKELPFLPI